MTEVLFYHLTEHSLERALPGLIERSLERGWRVVVQTATPEKRDALDQHLWTFRDDSFLPHAAESEEEGQGAPQDNPVWLTTKTENPNNSSIRFVVESAIPAEVASYERVIYMFDGHDDDAVAHARERWKIEKSAGHDLTYWQQSEEGRWEKKS